MKKFIFIIFVFSAVVSAQNFIVTRISGKVNALKGSSENWIRVNKGDTLSSEDVLETFEGSFVRLERDGESFILKNNSALGLNHIKRISLNELLLALAMEEIRNVPKTKPNDKIKNTAVYGENIGRTETIEKANPLGVKMLKGAKQLAESGFPKSAVIAAKETYRNFPTTKTNFDSRFYFAGVLSKLSLYEEAMAEIGEIQKLNLNSEQREKTNKLLLEIKKKITSK